MKQVFIFLTLFFALGLSAQKANNQNVKLVDMEPFHIDVDVETAKNMVRIQGDNLVFIDVRTPEEIAHGKIKGAVELNFKSPEFKQKLSELDKTKQYLVYAYAGGISRIAMNMMKDLGFKQVYNLDAGLKAWKQTEPVVSIK